MSHKNSHSSHLAQHVARALVVASFTLEHYLTFHMHSFPTSARPSTRPLLFSTSHRDLSCADPSNVSFGPLAETHSPTGHEPKDLTEEDISMLVKSMFFHRPGMTSPCDSPFLNRIWIMSKMRNMLASPLYLKEREASADRSRVYHSFRENSVFSSSHFRESAGKKDVAVFSQFGKSSQDTFSCISSGHQTVQGKGRTFFRFSDPDEAARTALEELRDHLLADAKSETFWNKNVKLILLTLAFVNFKDKLIPIV